MKRRLPKAHRLPIERLENRMLLSTAQAYEWNSAVVKANGFIDGAVYAPGRQNEVFIHTDMGGAYRWDNANQKWAPMTDGLAVYNDPSTKFNGVETMAVDPTNPDRVYMAVGTYDSTVAIFSSTDAGLTWSRHNASFTVNGNGPGRNAGERMNVDPNSPNILIYGTRHDGIWKSVDYGATWNKVSSLSAIGDTSGGGGGVGVDWTLFDKNSATAGNPTQTIYAGVCTTGVNKIYRSLSGGTTWEVIPGAPAGATQASRYTIRAVLTPDGNSLYITYCDGNPGPGSITGGDVFRIDNPDAVSPTWNDLPMPFVGGSNPGGFSGIALDPTDPHTVYVSTDNRYTTGDDMLRSTNDGQNWTGLDAQNHRDNSAAKYAESIGLHWTGDLQIDPFNHNVAMFTTGFGMWRTTNLTATNPTWSFFNEGFEQSAMLELTSPNTGTSHLITAMGDRDGFRHLDFNVSPISGLLGQSQNMQMGSSPDIDAAFNNGDVIVRVGANAVNGSRAQYSLDNGVTWNSFAGLGTGPGNIAVSSDGSRAFWDPGGTTVMRYSILSGGAFGSWQTPATAPPNNLHPVADLVNANTMYAFGGGNFYRSTDGGAHWADTNTAVGNGGLPTAFSWVRAVPGHEGHLFLSTGDTSNVNGLWRSTDGGVNWSRVNQNSVSVAYVVAVGAQGPNANYPSIYIGGSVDGHAGFFRSDDEGATWFEISDVDHQFGRVTVIQADPRVYGRIYVGTNGRGVQYGDISASPGDISGNVFNDPNSNGTKNAGENGIAGWIVYLDANNNNVLDGGETSATTDANGDYVFANLSPGSYHVKQQLQGGYRKTQPGTGIPGYDVTVSGGEVTGKDFGVTTNIYLAGKVFNDVNGNGTMDAGETGIGGQVINIVSNGSTIASRTTDASGAWQVKGLAAGSGEADLVIVGDYSATNPVDAKYVGSMTSGQQNANLNFGLKSNAVSTPNVLFTTATDFGGWAAVDAGVVVTPGATGDSDASTINGVGNDSSPGGAGTAGAVRIDAPSGYKQARSTGMNGNAAAITAIKNNHLLTLDYTLPSMITTTGQEYWQILLVFNFNNNYLSVNNNPVFSGAGLVAGEHSVTYDYSAQVAALPSTPDAGLTYYQLFLVINSSATLNNQANGGTSVYIDDVRVSGGPAAAAAAISEGSILEGRYNGLAFFDGETS